MGTSPSTFPITRVQAGDLTTDLDLTTEELLALLQDFARIRLEIHVQPELLISAASRVLPGDALDGLDAIERRTK